MKKYAMWLLAGSIALTMAGAYVVHASDHDDGEIDLKGRNLNLTDLYVFREGDQNSSLSTDNLIFIMNSNPRSMAGFQYYFSTQARYEFHVSNVSGRDTINTSPAKDTSIRFTFAAPDANKRQAITVTSISGGTTYTNSTDTTGAALTTTSLADSAAGTLKTFNFSVNGQTLTLFAGLREDPFFFDVVGFFRVRQVLLGGGTVGAGDLDPGSTNRRDFTAGYNVNAIVLRVPKAFLGGSTGIYDVWETISVPR